MNMDHGVMDRPPYVRRDIVQTQKSDADASIVAAEHLEDYQRNHMMYVSMHIVHNIGII